MILIVEEYHTFQITCSLLVLFSQVNHLRICCKCTVCALFSPGQKYLDEFLQVRYTQCKKYFQDLLSSQHIFFCQINFFEFLMVKLIYFIVLTHFFQFNQLTFLRQPRLLTCLS